MSSSKRPTYASSGYDSEEARRAARQSLHLPLDRRLILYVGGLAPHKNLAGLIEGYAAAVKKDPRLADVDLVLAGDPKGDGFHSNVENLHARVDKHGLKDRVYFPGFVPDAGLWRSIPMHSRSRCRLSCVSF